MRINGHSHLLPYPEQIPSYLKEKEIFWIDEDRKHMLQKNWKRPVTDSSFFLNEKLEWMERNRIDYAVVLNLSQLYGNVLRIRDMKYALRFQNDFNAQVQNDHPTKFTCGFVVHAGFIDGACWEIERCLEKLGLKVLCLPTHYMDSVGNWRGIFDEETAPIFELANKYNLAIEIHPYDGKKFIHIENRAWRFHLIWMLAQCADAHHFYTLEGLYEKYPNIRVCFAHGGQLNHLNIGRRTQGFDGRPDLFEGMTRPRKAIAHPNIFFDTLVHDTFSLDLMVRRQKGTNQIISKENLEAVCPTELPEAIIIRTLPNTEDKRTIDYSGTNPPYLDSEAMQFLVENRVKHLLLDLPSVDKEEDQGKLVAHHIFWNVKGKTVDTNARKESTITELIYVPNSIKDGLYMLNIQVPSLPLDAAPSRPVLYQLHKISITN